MLDNLGPLRLVERINKDDLALLFLQTLLLLQQRICVDKATEELLCNHSLCVLLGAHSVSETLVFVDEIVEEELIVEGEEAIRAEIAARFMLNTSGHHKAVHALLLIGKSSLTVIP